MMSTAISAHDIRLAIEDGKLVVTFSVPCEIVKQAAVNGDTVIPRLTRREQETFEGLRSGKTNKEIAATLNLSERTVKFHVSSLLAKFHAQSRVQILMLGVNKIMS